MTDEVSTASIGVEDTGARHRRERRELQATVQQLKKSINKNDKTRKKKVDGEIQALEDAFAKRWANFNENATPTQLAETAVAIVPEQAPSEASETFDDKQHVSRKARRLANKEKRHAEATADEEPIDYDNLPESIRRREEASLIQEQLTKRGLEVRSIASDGNCLFASLVDQSEDLNVRQLREQVAEYLRSHRKEFEPFVETDFDTYCDKLAKENTWGGQLELQACANILNRPIEVIQGNRNEPIIIDAPSASATSSPIVISYHRYLYANGEHYNSTTTLSERDDE